MVLGEPLCHIGLVYWRQFFMAKSCSAPFVKKKAIHRDLIQTFPKNSNRAGRKRTKSGSTWLMEGAPRPMIWAAHPLAEDLEDLRPWGFPFDPEISTDLHSKCVFFWGCATNFPGNLVLTKTIWKSRENHGFLIKIPSFFSQKIDPIGSRNPERGASEKAAKPISLFLWKSELPREALKQVSALGHSF